MTVTIMTNITKMTIEIRVMTNMTIIMNDDADEYIHLSANSAVTMVAMNARSSTTAMEMLDFFGSSTTAVKMLNIHALSPWSEF